MQPPLPARDGLPFSAAVLLPVVLALAITAASLVGYIVWSTANIDQRALERQTFMVSEAMQAKHRKARHDLESLAIWDDAVANTRVTFNLGWVDANIGRWAHDIFEQNLTTVLDSNNRALYVMRDGRAVPPASFAAIAAPFLPLVDRVRALNAGRTGSSAGAPPQGLSDFAIIDGVPTLISVMSIISSSGAVRQTAGNEFVIASAQSLDDAAATQLAQDYLFEHGRFTANPSPDQERAVFPILNEAGRFIAFFEWQRDQPGLIMLRQTGPAIAGAFLVGCMLVFLLLGQLRRSSAALEAGRRHAEHQAAHDQLTGLPNRASFDAQLARSLHNHQINPANLSLLMLDLDRFKQINDTRGHQAGDMLICAVGERLRTIVGPDMMIARLGGDEFGILAIGADGPIDTLDMSDRIIQAVGKPFDLKNFNAHVGVSIGIVTAHGEEEEPQELIRKADIALYEAKAGGRNRAVTYEEHMNELLQLQHTIEAELRQALLRQDQLSVAFQPLVEQRTRKVIGAEALARWNHPKFGQISPARFIPVAESSGLIERLGEFVLRRACEMGATVPGRTIAVNISTTQLRNPHFSNEVFDILRETGMRPTDLELEITESILLDDEHISAQNLRTVREAGIHVALDDFGTGYSSLSYLKRYPVDRIKIDRSFVSQLAEGHDSVAITQAIVTLAHAMNIDVTAEGVETENQATILGTLGCNTLQGFLFSGAVPPERISAIFADAANAPAQRRHNHVA